ncbi:MAG: sigma-70 family RNA polymerase sigma factor [Alphaproteobacteria bacterium]
MAEAPTAQIIDGDPLARALSRVALGDRNAFETVYRQASSRVFAICLRVLSDRAEAEDVVQEVFTTVWHKAAQFDASRASAITWLGMIARNRAIDRLRAAPAANNLAPIELADDIADSAPSPASAAERTAEGAALEECMQQLDGRRRSLIRVAFFEGATYEELAARVGSPLGSVKSWIRRGLLQLKACLER